VSAKQIQKLLRSGFVSNCRHHAPNEISNYAFSNLHNFQKVKKRNDILRTHVECFLAAMKAQNDEGGGRILLDDNTGGGTIMRRPFSFDVLECEFQVDSLV
jgi:hypothetical protein